LERNELHEHHGVALALMVLGGIFDSYAYILLDGSFASMQTGNAVFLVLSLARGDFALISRYLLPLVSFSGGILVSQIIRSRTESAGRGGRYGTVLLIEGILLALIGIGGHAMNHRIIAVLIAFMAAVQVSTFDRVKGASYASTMITGNLRSGMEQLYLYLFKGEREGGVRARIYGGLIIFFALGVLIGAEGVKYFGEKALLLCLPPLLGVYLFIRRGEGSGAE